MHNVIIADDEMKVCQLIQKLVDWDSLGLCVAGVANDGLTALELIKRHQPDMLITDIRMPGVDGIELIRRAKQMRPSLQCIIISGYRHFDYAHNAIRYGVEDYLLKPINQQEFLATLQKLIQKQEVAAREQQETAQLKRQAFDLTQRMQEEFLRRLLSGGAVDGEALAALPHMHREGGYTCAIIKPDLENVPPGDRLHGLAVEKTLALARQHLQPAFSSLLACAAPEGVLCAFHPGEVPRKEVEEAFRLQMEEILPLRALFPSLEVTVGLSQPGHSLSGLPQAMGQAYQALCQRLIRGTGKLIIYEPQPVEAQNRESYLDGETRKQLLAALEILDEGGYHAQLEKAFLDLRKAGRPILELRNAMKEMIYLHFLGLQNHAQPEGVLQTYLTDFQSAWDAATTLDAVEQSLASLLCGHLQAINRERDEVEMRPIRLAKKYMQENYQSNITLEDVAAVAGFHPAYFSTVFKKVTGENFLEYLCALRMKEARQLLSDAGLRVTDVAERVGYQDGKYFVKLFKKATGLTPQEYRKLYY